MSGRSFRQVAPLVVVLNGCGGSTQAPVPAAPPPAEKEAAKPAPPAVPPASDDADGPRRFENVGFSTPESVLHDPVADVWIVSNIDGAPTARDGNGFLSRIDPKTGKVDAKWIASGRNGVVLDAPKGLALQGSRLAVADIDRVRFFDRATGAPAGEVRIEGARFLNDLAPGPGGSLYVSDTGVGAPKERPADAVYRIAADGSVAAVAGPGDLGGPNGLAAQGDRLWVVTFRSGRIFELSDATPEGGVPIEGGSLDGIVLLPDGSALVSSWGRKAVLRGALPAGPFAPVRTGLPAPADIGYDAARRLVLVPLFEDDAVVALPLPPRGP